MWKYYALLSAFFAALTALFSKMGVEEANPDLALALRVTFIFVLCWGIAFTTGASHSLRTIGASTWFYLLLSALTTGFSWLFYFKALAAGDVAKVAPLDKLSVPIAIVLAVIFLGEALTWKVICGGALITLGSIVLML